MANVNFEWDADEAFNRWEKIEAEAAEAKRRTEQFVLKSTLPYTESLAQEICERISCGELLLVMCNDDHMPTMRRCNQWLKEHLEFSSIYKESINDRLNVFEEQVILIADDASRDFKEVVRNGRTVRVLDGEAIARAKLRVEVRFRHLKAGRPNKWGEVSTLITKDADAANVADMSIDELEKKLAEIDLKDRITTKAA
jgi:hypothetical protein